MKVLLVDDSHTMRRIQKNVLLEAGVESVLEAADGVQALRVLRDDPAAVRLVLLDINMPNKDGISTLQEIRADDALKGIPVIMVSSEAERSIVLKAIECGANDYCVKPFRKEGILQKIQKYVQLA